MMFKKFYSVYSLRFLKTDLTKNLIIKRHLIYSDKILIKSSASKQRLRTDLNHHKTDLQSDALPLCYSAFFLLDFFLNFYLKISYLFVKFNE